MKNILAITLARGGSKGIKNKNIVKINSKPLIAHTIIEARKSKLINEYIVSTDSLEIAKVAQYYGASVPFIRPKNLSSSKATSASALKHAINFMEKKNSIKYDYIVELMCTNPLKTVFDIDSSIKKILKYRCNAVIAVHKLDDHHPARIKKIVNGELKNFCIPEKKESRRQDLKPDAYIRSGSIYVLKRDYLVKNSRRHGNIGVMPYILPQDRAINIDSQIDLITAEMMFKNGKA